jgi:hypothetical protein
MAIVVELPADVEKRLRAASPDLDSAAKEALLIEFYREDKLTRYELSQALGLTRFEIDALLKKHNVTTDLPTLEELEEDFRVAKSLMDQ